MEQIRAYWYDGNCNYAGLTRVVSVLGCIDVASGLAFGSISVRDANGRNQLEKC